MPEGEPRAADTEVLYTDTEINVGEEEPTTWITHAAALRVAETGTFKGQTRVFRTDVENMGYDPTIYVDVARG